MAALYARAVRATGTFRVVAFNPTSVEPVPTVTTALPVTVSTMEKHFQGAVEGRSATLFTAAYDQEKGVGTYVAMESFDGSVDGHRGSMNFVHSATTSGADRLAEFFTIVPGSRAGSLSSISGTGGLRVDPDGTHHVWLEYDLEIAGV